MCWWGALRCVGQDFACHMPGLWFSVYPCQGTVFTAGQNLCSFWWSSEVWLCLAEWDLLGPRVRSCLCPASWYMCLVQLVLVKGRFCFISNVRVNLLSILSYATLSMSIKWHMKHKHSWHQFEDRLLLKMLRKAGIVGDCRQAGLVVPRVFWLC